MTNSKRQPRITISFNLLELKELSEADTRYHCLSAPVAIKIQGYYAILVNKHNKRKDK